LNGIFFWKTNNSKIDNIDTSGNYYGIHLSYSSNNKLIGNKASDNGYTGGYGIYLDSSSNNELIGNNASNNIRYHSGICPNGFGISLFSSSNNTLSGNTASNNGGGCGGFGISLEFSSKNTLSGNTASNNGEMGYGIYLDSSNNNTIYNNYFNNTNNAFDDGINIWNITKQSGTNIIGGSYLGGNYWSDYAGSDLNGDGLGDTLVPYNSSGNIANGGDYLPLTIAPTPTAGSISGYKINDTNGNGKWDAGEKGISNWTIRLIGIIGKGKNATVIRNETLTDATGFYKFDNLSAGRYFVIEKLKKGFVATSSPVNLTFRVS
jgi:parallel beta-helix repeat protein